MYLRAAHAELDIPTLQAFIRENPLGIIITALESPNFHALQCTHVPWVLDLVADEGTAELGRLRGHLARANPHAKALIEAVQRLGPSNGTLAQEVTVLFNGPVHSYVTPKYYTTTKPATGKVVPTWNYSAAQVYGKANIFWDTKNDETDTFLDSIVRDLTKNSEELIMHHTGGDNPTPWQVDDAPKPYLDIMRKNIMGVEIEITALEGKFKMSQELTKGDRDGVIHGFDSLGTEGGAKIARTVEERGALKDAKSASADAPTATR